MNEKQQDKTYLIIESLEPEANLVEAETVNEGRDLYIQGIFAQAEKENGNGRIYPKRILEEAAEEYIEKQVKRKQSLGELNHPPDRIEVDPALASHIIEDMWWDGNNLMGRAKILGTTRGREVRSLMEGGWIPGVSTRGTGQVKKKGKINEVQPGYKMRVGVDIVHGPSAPEAFVEGIYECTESGIVVPSHKNPAKKSHFYILKHFKVK